MKDTSVPSAASSQSDDDVRRFGALLDRSSVAALVVHADTLRVMGANGAARKLLRHDPDGPGVTLGELAHHLSRPNFDAVLRPLRDGLVDHVVVETRRHTPDGAPVPIEIHVSYSSEPEPCYLCLLFDTSRRSSSHELAERREHLRDALDEILRAITRIDNRADLYSDACRIAVERGGFRMAWIGIVDEATGQIVPVASAGHVDRYLDTLKLTRWDVRQERSMTATALSKGQPAVVSDISTDPLFEPWKDEAAERGYRSAVALPLNVEEAPIGALMVYASEVDAFGATEVQLLEHLAEDISFKIEVIGREERRGAAEAERDLLAAVVEQAGESVIMTDRDGRIVYTNPAFTRNTGYERAEVLGRRSDFLQADSRHPEAEAAISAAIHEGGSWSGQSTERCKDGSERELHLTVAPRRNSAGRIIGSMTIGRDVSRERALEAQLTQSQKLEAIGRFAGGIAHDFNNLLTAISGYAEILRMGLAGDDPRLDDLTEIQRAASRATQLTGQLLAFSRRQILSPKAIDPHTVVAELAPMLHRLIGEEIDLIVRGRPGLGPIMADQGQLDQVLVNLVLNARDAMPSGGRIVIDVRPVSIDDEYVAAHVGARTGSFVVFEVGDTGLGMTPEVLAHAFEPFYTTKNPGKGTGLGLSTVLGVVEQSNGYVEVESQPGVGTTFRLYLPCAAGNASVATPGVREPSGHTGSGTILVVEDEEPVRSFLCRVLQQSGYKVLQAGNGEDALRLEQGYSGRIDLLFTDVVMPGMNGRELADELVRRRPGTPVLYASGYNEEIVAARGVLDPEVSYLPKPYTAADIQRRLRELINPAKETPGT